MPKGRWIEITGFAPDSSLLLSAYVAADGSTVARVSSERSINFVAWVGAKRFGGHATEEHAKRFALREVRKAAKKAEAK